MPRSRRRCCSSCRAMSRRCRSSADWRPRHHRLDHRDARAAHRAHRPTRHARARPRRDPGSDHSSHMFSSAFALWSAARVGYPGSIRWHRGYNVAAETPTLSGADFSAAEHMLGYFDACYMGCGPCGTSCATIDVSHATWLQRQYSTARADATTGALVAEVSGACASVTAGGAVTLGDCASATTVALSAAGQLTAGGACATSAEHGPIAFAPCTPGDPQSTGCSMTTACCGMAGHPSPAATWPTTTSGALTPI